MYLFLVSLKQKNRKNKYFLFSVVSELNQAANNEMEIVNMKQQLDQYETSIHDYKVILA